MHELVPVHTSAIDQAATIEQMIAQWLNAKVSASGSQKTKRAYTDVIHSFRATLQSERYDLFDDPRVVSMAAQGWAGRPSRNGETPKPASYNQRLAILSSFYAYVKKQGHTILSNPIDRVERRKVHAYQGARPIAAVTLRERLGAIDRTTMAGMRDHLLLMVALITCRRVDELAGLRWGDVERRGQQATLVFRHCKGGKQMRDTLPIPESRELFAWLHRIYGPHLEKLSPDAPIWIPAFRNGTIHQAITTQAIADICKKRLGVSKVHALRHTGAHAMQDRGAAPSVIQAQLGHESLATTGKYLTALDSGQTPYGEAVAAMFRGGE